MSEQPRRVRALTVVRAHGVYRAGARLTVYVLLAVCVLLAATAAGIAKHCRVGWACIVNDLALAWARGDVVAVVFSAWVARARIVHARTPDGRAAHTYRSTLGVSRTSRKACHLNLAGATNRHAIAADHSPARASRAAVGGRFPAETRCPTRCCGMTTDTGIASIVRRGARAGAEQVDERYTRNRSESTSRHTHYIQQKTCQSPNCAGTAKDPKKNVWYPRQMAAACVSCAKCGSAIDSSIRVEIASLNCAAAWRLASRCEHSTCCKHSTRREHASRRGHFADQYTQVLPENSPTRPRRSCEDPSMRRSNGGFPHYGFEVAGQSESFSSSFLYSFGFVFCQASVYVAMPENAPTKQV